MNYLGWELERQQSALRALLLGGEDARAGERQDPGRTGTEEGPSAPQAGRSASSWEEAEHAPARKAVRGARADRPPREDGGAPGGGTWLPEVEAAFPKRGGRDRPEAAAIPEPRGAAPPRPAFRGGRTAAPEPADHTGAGPGKTASAGERGAGAAAGRSGTGLAGGTGAVLERHDAGARALPAGQGWTLRRDGPWSGGAATLRAEEEAAALSRAVQRDARRYDGGFTIY